MAFQSATPEMGAPLPMGRTSPDRPHASWSNNDCRASNQLAAPSCSARRFNRGRLVPANVAVPRNDVRVRFSRLSIFVVMTVLFSTPAAAREPTTLSQRLLPLIEAHRGRVAVAVRHLENDDQFLHHEDEVFPTASLIKFPVLVELYRQAEEGRVDLDHRITLRAEDKVPGSGILTPHFSPGATLALVDAARLMIAFSDNTATNLVLDQIGIASTGEAMRRLGCPNTRIHHKVYLGATTSI